MSPIKFSLLGPESCKVLSNDYWNNSWRHERWPDMPGIKRMSVNNLPMMRVVHEAMLPWVQSLVGEPIKATYSFVSAYERGSSLPPHTDRPQCQYNVTLLLDASPDPSLLPSWPLHILHRERFTDEVLKFSLGAGDAVLYSGTQDKHWREPMPNGINWVLGVFFHYVRLDFQGSLD